MLVGVNLITFDTGEIEEGDFFVKFKLRNKEDGFQWLCNKETLPILIGGDFNIIRCPTEKNNANYCDRWPFLFNAVIEAVVFSLGQLICKHQHMRNWIGYCRVRIGNSNSLVLLFRPLSREISDHTSLLLNTGKSTLSNNTPRFKFELGGC
ncbi:hypothetical protein U9M48_041978 [Paspalum notatum var. saurae]|uniref:Uncharacterized protein n=1 Tax=Paspalum notatum var. saurae TaxID=547442 RepID=A0AAQ3URV5_PASNO